MPVLNSAVLVDIETATEATVAELDTQTLGPSVDVLVRHHFNPAVVHDPDLAFFARAASVVSGVPVFLDIGASIANTISSLMALDCRFQVDAFEINPALHAHLRHATALYPDECVIHPYGLGERPERSWLYVPALNDFFVLGEASLSLAHLQQDRVKAQLRSYAPGAVLRVGKLSVESRTLDSLALRPDFIKIDVEGAEARVLAGATDTLDRNGPLIMAENSYPEEVQAVLAPLGYSPHRFDPVRGVIRPQDTRTQNTFYVDDTWRSRLSSVGLIGA